MKYGYDNETSRSSEEAVLEVIIYDSIDFLVTTWRRQVLRGIHMVSFVRSHVGPLSDVRMSCPTLEIGTKIDARYVVEYQSVRQAKKLPGYLLRRCQVLYVRLPASLKPFKKSCIPSSGSHPTPLNTQHTTDSFTNQLSYRTHILHFNEILELIQKRCLYFINYHLGWTLVRAHGEGDVRHRKYQPSISGHHRRSRHLFRCQSRHIRLRPL